MMSTVKLVVKTLFIFLFFFPVLLKGQQNISWVVEAPSDIYVGSQFSIAFTLFNAKGSVKDFPSFPGFNKISGPNHASNYSNINGVEQSYESYLFTLEANQQGVYSIGEASIDVGGKIMKTKPLSIEVKKFELGNFKLPTGDIKAKPVLKASKKNLYIGEQCKIDYFLYLAERVGHSEPPRLNIDSFFTVKNIDIEPLVIQGLSAGGREILAENFGSKFIYPNYDGVYTVKAQPLLLQKKKPGTAFGIFENFIQEKIPFDPIEIRVKALPQNAPKNFCGEIGKPIVSASIDSNSYTTNQSIRLVINIEGTSDVNRINAPEQDFGANFTQIPSKVIENKEFFENGMIRYRKSFEYLLSPKREGEFTLQPSISYFDPSTESYQQITLNTSKFKVSKGSDITNLFNDQLSSTSANRNMLWLYILLPLTLIGGLFYFYKRKPTSTKKKELSEEEILLQKRESAGKVAMQNLKNADQLMQSKQYDAFYKEIGNSINFYLQNKFSISLEQMEKNNIQKIIVQKPNGLSLANDYLATLEKAELSMYGGKSDENMQEAFDKAKNFIVSMELE